MEGGRRGAGVSHTDTAVEGFSSALFSQSAPQTNIHNIWKRLLCACVSPMQIQQRSCLRTPGIKRVSDTEQRGKETNKSKQTLHKCFTASKGGQVTHRHSLVTVCVQQPIETSSGQSLDSHPTSVSDLTDALSEKLSMTEVCGKFSRKSRSH